MRCENYFDYAATTPAAPEVIRAVAESMTEEIGNPHSIHALGRAAHVVIESARSKVAALVGCSPEQIVFTSGATESNLWFCAMEGSLAASTWEHSSMREGVRRAEGTFFDPAQPAPTADRLSCILVSNETGDMTDPSALSTTAVLHTDATQALGKIPVKFESVDFASFSAHKLYGPKGIGAMYVRDGHAEPWFIGGGQEEGRRSGTANVAGIVGFGVAAELALHHLGHDFDHAQQLLSVLMTELDLPGVRPVRGKDASPYIVALTIDGVAGQSLVEEMDLRGFAISAGAACSSQSTAPSPVLLAMGMSEDEARSTVRISFGRENTEESTRDLAAHLTRAIQNLKSLK